MALELLNKHKFTNASLSTDPVIWTEESNEIAENFVYQNATYKGVLSAEYLERGAEIAEERIVLGGYRLASVLKSVLQWRVNGHHSVKETEMVTQI